MIRKTIQPAPIRQTVDSVPMWMKTIQNQNIPGTLLAWHRTQLHNPSIAWIVKNQQIFADRVRGNRFYHLGKVNVQIS